MRRIGLTAQVVMVVFVFAGIAPVTLGAQGGNGGGSASSSARLAVPALRVPQAIRVDGNLDDEAWQRSAVAKDFTQSEPREGQPATEATEVMIAFDDQYLYIGARMHDSDPTHEIVNDIRKDFREDDQDDFEIIIDTFRDRRNGYVFIVNPEGGRVDR